MKLYALTAEDPNTGEGILLGVFSTKKQAKTEWRSSKTDGPSIGLITKLTLDRPVFEDGVDKYYWLAV